MRKWQPSVKHAPAAEAADHADLADDLWARLPSPLGGIAAAMVALPVGALATCLGLVLGELLPRPSVALVYLLSVMVTALAYGTKAGLAVAVLDFLAYNFFFIPPLYTFTIADPQELFALLVFLAVALLTGSLAGRMREAADTAWRRADTLQSLNDFAASLSGARDAQTISQALADQTGAIIGGHAVVMLAEEGRLQMSASTADAAPLESAELQAAERVLRSGTTIPAVATGWPGPRHEFQGLKGAQGPIGVVGFMPVNGLRHIDVADHAVLQTLFRHAAIAIERTQLELEAAAARDAAEKERLRSALLSSLSHDLRTPLSSILGAATSLRELGDAMTPPMRADLLATIEEEAERLSRFVSNLLDMTRLATAGIDIMRDWVDVGDAAQVAVSRARRSFPTASIKLTLEPDLPAIRGDASLVEHVVFNLLDNAVKFSGGVGPVVVDIGRRGDEIVLSVVDQGRGIPKDALRHVFETFYRVKGDSVPGTGLGLAICRKIVEGMGGTIRAESPVVDDRGTKIIARLPLLVSNAMPGYGTDGAP